MRFFCAICITWAASLFGAWVEWFEDWRYDALGTAEFETPPNGSYVARFGQIAREKGYQVRRWDRKAHTPWLRTRKSISTWREFCEWIGWGRPLRPTEDVAFYIFSNLGTLLRNLDVGRLGKERLILVMWEPAPVQPEIWDPQQQAWFHKIFTWDDRLVDNVRFFKFYPPYRSPRINELVPYEERKFLTLIASRLGSKHPEERYSDRERAVRLFEAHPEIPFDLYGRYWAKRKYRCWHGEIPDKLAVLKQYRFALAYENAHAPGYITEKLWDCFAAGVVPIYWGAPNVVEYIPADCFIDRWRFADELELTAYLQAMTREEWEGYVKRAGEFLMTEGALRFTQEFYGTTVGGALPQSRSLD